MKILLKSKQSVPFKRSYMKNWFLGVMPRKTCYWTRKLELDLVEFVRSREFIWKPFGNTNHAIQQKYKAYAEFAAKLGKGFTACSVRDRWVNIRSTFNHNLRRVDKSKETAHSSSEVYVPCWPLWKPLQFLCEVSTRHKEVTHYEGYTSIQPDLKGTSNNMHVKEEIQSKFDEVDLLKIRQRGLRTDRPRRRIKYPVNKPNKTAKCKRVLDNLIQAMSPFTSNIEVENQQYWFFGRHVTERLNSMRDIDAECATLEITRILNSYHGESVKVEAK